MRSKVMLPASTATTQATAMLNYKARSTPGLRVLNTPGLRVLNTPTTRVGARTPESYAIGRRHMLMGEILLNYMLSDMPVRTPTTAISACRCLGARRLTSTTAMPGSDSRRRRSFLPQCPFMGESAPTKSITWSRFGTMTGMQTGEMTTMGIGNDSA